MESKKTLPGELELQRLCGVAEAARFLSISRSSLYSLMDRGVVDYVKLGRSRRIQVASLLALIAANRVGR
jgi:excisionase family DNA binding protein